MVDQEGHQLSAFSFQLKEFIFDWILAADR